jgi:hypothetical protein
MQSATPTTTPRRSTRKEAERALAESFSTFPRFCGLLELTDKTGARVPFRLNRTQRDYVRNRTSRDVVLKGRQVGLTTVILALMLYRFLTVPGARVVIVCQAMVGDSSSRAISDTLEMMIQSLERRGVKFDFETRSTKHWKINGRDATLSIIEAGASKMAAEKKGRSQKITHLHLTECAYYEYAEETLRAILKCVPAEEYGSEIIYECTANGAHGEFYEQCESARRGENGYAFHFFPWYQHDEYQARIAPGEVVEPKSARQRLLVETHGITKEQLKWWQLQVALDKSGGEDHINQEYPSDPDTCFLVSGRGFFDASRIGAMLASARQPTHMNEIREAGIAQMRDGRAEVPAIRVWHVAVPGEDYVVACDTSEGVGGSAAGAVVLERRSGRHMATLWAQIPPWELARFAVALCKKFNNALLVVERNNHGHTVLRAAAAEQKYKRIFCDRDERPGWLNNAVTRAPALDTLEEAIRAVYFATNDVYLLREMRTFVVDDKGKAKGAKGARDDLVMMLAIGYDVLCRALKKKRGGWIDELPPA